MKLLLHACCGPCSLEPVRLLQQAGHDITIAFINSNIHPQAEYDLRLATLRGWAQKENLPVVEGTYAPSCWEETAGRIAAEGVREREERCRACYRLRFQEAARYAANNGFDALGTTLTVSPYQYTDIIREELEAAGHAYGIETLFEDFRPLYDEATRRSRTLGMYRQNYCGCRISQAEAAAQRAERKRLREAEKEAKRAANAERRTAEEHAREVQQAEKRAYAEKQAEKRRARKAFRATMQEEPSANHTETTKEENTRS
ncbi:MAG: epoxyqueuosine reductase QueH [Raoultibacter sp.]